MCMSDKHFHAVNPTERSIVIYTTLEDFSEITGHMISVVVLSVNVYLFCRKSKKV